VKPYKKIGEEAESDHGTDNEVEVRGNQEIALSKKKKRVNVKKKIQSTEDEAGTKNTEINMEVTKPRKGMCTYNNFIYVNNIFFNRYFRIC